MIRKLRSVLVVVALLLLPASSTDAREVTYWVWGWAPAMQEGIDRAIELFEDEHPDITVVKHVGVDVEQLVTAIAAGVPPDLVLGTVGTFEALLTLDALEPLSDRFARSGLWDQLLPGLEVTSRYQGIDYAVPGVAVYPLDGLVWNKAMFAEAGIPNIDARAAITWDELADHARKLVRWSGEGALERLGYHPLEGRNSNRDVLEAYFDLVLYRDGRPRLDSPEVISAFEFLNDNFILRQATGYDEVMGLISGGWYHIAEGRTAMANLGAYAPAELGARAPQWEFGLTWHPTLNGERKQQVVAFQNFIPKGASDVDAAWELATFLATSRAAQAHIFESTAFFGPAQDFVEHHEFDNPMTSWFIASMSGAEALQFQTAFPYGEGIPSPASFNVARIAIMNQEVAPAIALQRANDEWLVEIRRVRGE